MSRPNVTSYAKRRTTYILREPKRNTSAKLVPRHRAVKKHVWEKEGRASVYVQGKICPGFIANDFQIPYDKHNKVSSLVKSHQNTHNSVKYEVLLYIVVTICLLIG